jgi:anion-transporting  ArsA/GET3 family ATPase
VPRPVNGRAFRRRALLEPRVSVCVGCGGVGKTTVAAAFALEAARCGRKVLVLTIDPARRLADALGVEALGNVPQAMPRETLDRLGVAEPGHLSAMMLDMKRTFDDLVERFADDAAARDRILRNPIYQHVSDALAGSVEYSAMEKVYEVYESGQFDLIVVDTPPAQHALDFLDAPRRLLQFLDSRVVQMLIHPAFAAGRFGFRLFHRGTQRMLQLVEKISGVGFLEDISEFLLAFEGMAEGFRARAKRVHALLEGPETAFVLVTGPERESVTQSQQFLDRLETQGLPLVGIVANRVRAWPSGDPPQRIEASASDLARLATALGDGEGPDFPAETAARAAVEGAEGYAALVRRDAAALQPLRARTEAKQRYWGSIPELPEDVHDLDGLDHIGRLVFEAKTEDSAADGEVARSTGAVRRG